MLLFIFVLLLLSSCTSITEPAGPVYLSEVYDYVYAPGQHAHLAQPTDTQFVTGNPDLHEGWLYLGGFGGYVVAGFPRDIINEEGADFEVFALKGAAPEPAVVFVMSDVNGNNRPDDTWYELKGNLLSESKRNYTVTYYKPTAAGVNVSRQDSVVKVIVTEPGKLVAPSSLNDIRWEDSENVSGELFSFFGTTNSSSWWWPYTSATSISFTGTRLPDAYENQPVGGADFWVVPDGRFQWGYAENNHGTDYVARSGSNQLDISNAVDANGQHVQLTSIRFIKIQSAILQQAGQINEVSPEIRGARSLR